MKTAFITMAILINSGAYAAQTSSSDVIKYALTSHGIKYLLRDKRGSVNAWKSGDRFTNIPANGSSVPAKRWGNTDCSGLVSAAIRYNGYYPPEKRGKPALSTALFARFASKGKSDFSIAATGSKMINSTRHGDILNRSGSPYGHVFLFNGSDSRNMINTVEARCTKCGVGAFVKSWNDVLKTNYKLIRSSKIRDNVGNPKKVFKLSEASASKSVSNKSLVENVSISEHIVQPGENLETIAMEYGVNSEVLKALNPEVNFSRLKVGDQLMVNM